MNRNEGKPEEEWPKQDLKDYEDAHGQADYSKCVEISTKAAIKEMVKPGPLAVGAPDPVGSLGPLHTSHGSSGQERSKTCCSDVQLVVAETTIPGYLRTRTK